MPLEIRPLEGDDELEQVVTLTAERLAPNAVDLVRETLRAAYHACPATPPDHWFVAVDRGRVIGSIQVLDLEMRLGEVHVPLAGLQGIVLEPAFRGRGIFETFLTEVRAARQGRFHITGGFGRARIYRRFGVVPIVPDTEAVVTVTGSLGASGDAFGFRRATDDDLDTILSMYREANRHRNGTLARPPELWKWLIRKPSELWLHPQGYVGFLDDGDELVISEVGGEGAAFHSDALRFAAGEARRRGVRTVRAMVPPDHPFVEAAIPHGVTVTTTFHRDSWCSGMVLRPQPFLDRIAPELVRRAQEAGMGRVILDLRVTEAGGRRTGALLEVDGGGSGSARIHRQVTDGELLQMTLGYQSGPAVLAGRGERFHQDEADALHALFPRSNPFIWRTDRF